MNGTQRATLNEDWLKLVSWDVTAADGSPVTTLDQLAKVLDTDRVGAARELMAGPSSAAAPAGLRAEAEGELNPDPGQRSLLDEWIDGGDTAPAAAAGTPDEVVVEEEPEEKSGNPFAKKKGEGSADTGSSTRKQTIAAGAFVSWPGGRGKVEVVVTNGKVPGVDTDITGTKDAPAARVRVYEESGGDWKATEKRIAVKASSLKTIPPLGAAKFGKKSGTAALVALCSQLDPARDVPVDAVRTAYQRGTSAWPGDAKTLLSRDEWALGRAEAFVAKSRGADIPGYIGDDDLLPD